MRSYTPEYSTGIMDKSQRMRHGRERGDVNMGRWLNSWTKASGIALQQTAGVGSYKESKSSCISITTAATQTQ